MKSKQVLTKTLIKLILILLFVSLTIRSEAQDAQPLQKGSKSPYDGILMPRDHFDYLMVRELEADRLTQYISDPENKLAEPATPWAWFITFFVIGAGSGALFLK